MITLKDGSLWFKSRGIIGGICLMLVGLYQVTQGQYEEGAKNIALGVSAVGIRAAIK